MTASLIFSGQIPFRWNKEVNGDIPPNIHCSMTEYHSQAIFGAKSQTCSWPSCWTRTNKICSVSGEFVGLPLGANRVWSTVRLYFDDGMKWATPPITHAHCVIASFKEIYPSAVLFQWLIKEIGNFICYIYHQPLHADANNKD